MYTKKHYINLFSSAFLLLLNIQFILRYSGIFPFTDLFAVILYLVLSGGLILIFDKVIKTKTKKEAGIKILLVLLSPALYYEIINISGVFINPVLVIAVLFLMDRYSDPEKTNIKFFIFALLFGLLLATSIIVLIPFFLSLFYYFRYNIKNLVLFAFISLAVGFSLLYPFMKWEQSAFYSLGPFNDHLLNFSWWAYLILFLIILYAGWMISDFGELLFTSGVVLFLITFIIFLTDKNYLAETITCIPFLILSVREYEIDKFLGKIIDN